MFYPACFAVKRRHSCLDLRSYDLPPIENRRLKAEILLEEGKMKEALQQYESLVGVNNFLGIHYIGPSYIRRAEIYENLGDSQNAIDFYTRAIDLWNDADASLLPFVEQARAGQERVLDRMASEPS